MTLPAALHAPERKLDVFSHIFPPAYFERMKALARDCCWAKEVKSP